MELLPRVGGALTTLSARQARTIAAMAARIFPSDELGIGAAEAGVIFYIDRSLAGALAALLPRYEEGADALDAYSMARHGLPFSDLDPEVQDAVLRIMETAEGIPGFGASGSRSFFHLVIAHTRQGMFCDPAYGGNQGALGWRLLGFPGVQRTFTAEEQMGAPIVREHIGTMANMNFRYEPSAPATRDGTGA
jgi:gluconate 2-dehydrogenase gamma chain